MLLDYKQEKDVLTISYWNSEGRTTIKNLKLEYNDLFNWKVCRESDKDADPVYRNWDGKPVKRVDYPTVEVDENGNERLTKIPKLSTFRIAEIIDDFPKELYDEVFSYNIPKMVFVDIETEIGDEFPKPEEAKMPITCIGFATQKHKVYVYGVKPLTPRELADIQERINEHTKKMSTHFDFEYKQFKDETTLLYFFLSKNVPNFPMMSGWNFIDFDWTYIVNRAKKLGLDPKVSSPCKMLVGKTNRPLHVGMIDYMECYRKWDTNVSQKENFKLDQAGLDVLGIQKVHYSGSLQDLYEQDFPTYIYYNAIDCILVEMIHEKIAVSTIGCTLAYIANAQAMQMFSPVALTESIMARDFYKQKRILVPKEKGDKESDGYEGAYVKAPVVGYHMYCTCNDFASLYPNIIRELNLSPETFVEKLDENDETAKAEWLEKGYIVSESGCVFKKEPGVFSSLVGRVYNQRKGYKKKSYVASEKSFKLLELADNAELSDDEALAKMEEILKS